MKRLIDADALAREMYHKSFEVDDGRNVWNSGLWIRYKIFEEAIRDAPIVDAVPVRHGRWVAHTMSEITGYDPALSGDDPVCTYSCSVCGEDCYVSDTGDDILSNYCPNCGARLIE